ncbi:MAG: divalent cation tolerance protein CutA [Candidatus Bathyarchaeota archaeon]|nr:divalent cation tolerance protein CutA [Candidatus Bathyarchaeota archaeon]
MEKKLIACDKILNDATTQYLRQGKTEEARGFIIILKTCQEQFKEIHETIQRVHSYTVPKLITIPITLRVPYYLA